MGFAFGAAIMLGVTGSITRSVSASVVVACCLLLLALVIRSQRRRLFVAALIGLVVGFGGTEMRSHAPNAVSPQATLPVELDAALISDPRLAQSGHSVRIRWEAESVEPVESLMFYAAAYDIGRGDRVVARGFWSDTSDNLFIAARVEPVQTAGRIESARRSLRSDATRRVLQRVPGSNGSLALGLIIGDDSGLTGKEREELRASGLSHITAVSGSNVAMIIGVVALIMQALGRVSWYWFGVQFAGIVGYVWIIGTDPPILRAAIMGSLILIAGTIGRPTHLYTLLFLAGGIMCLADPVVILSLSFQLSFLSMIGLAAAGDVVQREVGVRRKILVALMSPAGAALATAPLLAGRFGTLSLGTLPANILVAPIIAPATGLAALAALIPTGFLTGKLAGMCLWAMTGTILAVSSTVAHLPYAFWRFAPLTNRQLLACYVILCIGLLPVIPEARLAGYRFRIWASAAPGTAAASILAVGVMFAALSLIVD